MASPSQIPIQIHVPPSLEKYTTPLKEYLAAHPPYTNLVVSAFIFSCPTNSMSSGSDQPTRLLILHRAVHERSFANRWEVPGGSSESNDPTILHSLAREVFEETGLILTRVVRQVGDAVEFQTGKGQREKFWAKLNFEIEVTGVNSHRGKASHVGSDALSETGAGNPSEVQHLAGALELETKTESKTISVRIDPQEHQSYAWATIEEVITGKYVIATPEQKELMIKAFQSR